ncbi:DUF4097 family beta strand repeat-containing protein [Nocardiopsis sp. NPDC006938]|uniref:DUF4097 family beta strand repeat-containing protein n=1 Tax=Nocardiopsis sp. NPDC006938 TaxID=3364337 RepID=UPI0036841698
MAVTFTTPADTLTTMIINGSDADVEVRTSAGLTEARIEIFGPEHLIADASVESLGSLWVLDLPQTSGMTTTTFRSSGGGMIVQAGRVMGGVIMNGGDIVVGGASLGSTHVITPDAQVRVVAHLPQGTNLTTSLTSGSLTTSNARLGAVEHTSSSGDITLGHVQELSARTSSGSVVVHRVQGLATVRTSSGQIILDGGTTLSLRSSSGAISYTATGDCSVSARTSSGSITIRRGGHQVQTQVRTSSGRVWDH